MYVDVHICVHVHVWVLIVYLCLYVCVGHVLQRFGLVRWDPNPATRDPYPIQIRAHCGTDTMVIRRPIHGMIHRSVLDRAVKTRWRFGSETASFHVSVRSCVFSYLPLSVCVYMLLLSFYVTFCCTLPVWLLVPLSSHLWMFTLIT